MQTKKAESSASTAIGNLNRSSIEEQEKAEHAPGVNLRFTIDYDEFFDVRVPLQPSETQVLREEK